jgi:hypothetical protein
MALSRFPNNIYALALADRMIGSACVTRQDAVRAGPRHRLGAYLSPSGFT